MMTNHTIDLRSASRLAEGLARGNFSAVEILEAVLEKSESPAASSVFTAMIPEQALAEANASDDRRHRGMTLSAWDGIPIAWKDIFDMAGTVTTAASAVRRNLPPAQQDAALVTTCRNLGMVSVGKTNLSEFAYSGIGINPHFGTPRNPRGSIPDCAPGGSSSGSAVAVAAGIVPVAVGTDTAGSVRVPASFCGVWGFKASQQHYPLDGVFPLSRTHDSIGSFANNCEDLVQFDALVRGKSTVDNPVRALSELTFLIPESVVFDAIEADVLATFNDFVERLGDAGAKIDHAVFPPFVKARDLFRRHGTLTVAEAYTWHHELLSSSDASIMDQRVRQRLETAKGFTARDYITLKWEREKLLDEAASTLGNRQLLFPTVARTAPSIPSLDADDDLFVETNLLVLRNTMLGSFLDMPGVSFPIGTDRNGLPIGALVSGLAGSDAIVLSSVLAIDAVAALSSDVITA